MGFELLAAPNGFSSLTYAVAGVVVVTLVTAKILRSQGPNLDAFPTVGPGLLSSWWMFRFVTNTTKHIQEGYEKHKPVPFKIANGWKWILIVSSPEHMNEIAKAPEHIISLRHAIEETINTQLILSPDIVQNAYHDPVVRHRLTRSIEEVYPEIIDSVSTAIDEYLDLSDDGWNTIPAFDFVQRIVCKSTNRLLWGAPLCHNAEWIDLNIHTVELINKTGGMLSMVPRVLRPLITLLCISTFRRIAQCKKYLNPIVEERLKYMADYGDKWIEKPNDLLSWLMDEAKGADYTLESLVNRILFVNSAAMHTTTNSFTHTLLYLAANPQYLKPLREEVEAIIDRDGWTTFSLDKMRKIDSFLKECARLEGIGAISLMRIARNDFRFSDGTLIPKGTFIGAASRPIHHDNEFYDNPYAFEPFRFADIQDVLKHQVASTSMDYLVFGHGRHACPGRFFAACEMKTMLAYLVLNYDVKLVDNTMRPPSWHLGPGILPDINAKVVIRKRAD